MIKDTIQRVIKKIKERNINKYSTHNLYLGTTYRRVDEDDLTYYYLHSECFQVEDINEKFPLLTMLTGNCDNEQPTHAYRVKDTSITIFRNGLYSIEIANHKKLEQNESQLTLDEIQERVNKVNEFNKNTARERQLYRSQYGYYEPSL